MSRGRGRPAVGRIRLLGSVYCASRLPLQFALAKLLGRFCGSLRLRLEVQIRLYRVHAFHEVSVSSPSKHALVVRHNEPDVGASLLMAKAYGLQHALRWLFRHEDGDQPKTCELCPQPGSSQPGRRVVELLLSERIRNTSK